MNVRATAVLTAALSAPSVFADEVAELRGEVGALRTEVARLAFLLQRRDDAIAGMTKELAALREELAAWRERGTPLALPFLSGPPLSSDAVGVARVAVFAPRVQVDASSRHDLVALRVRRVEAAGLRPVAETELGSDAVSAELPLDQNGGLYVVDWSTSEGHNFDLVLRDGASGQAAATVHVKPLQRDGRFLFVGYRID
jgi:hypothetical protein